MIRKLKRRLRRTPAGPRRWAKVKVYQFRHGRPAVEDAKRGKFVIARIMGNDLYPRHGDGQMLKNLQFILEHEPDFPDCTKIFVLNRLFDPDHQQQAERLIEKHGAESLMIPFEPAAYARIACDVEIFGGEKFFTSAPFRAEPKLMRDRMRIWAFGPKIRYAMNINGARNAALAAGKERAEWTAVLDGNCIFTAGSFARLRRDCEAKPFLPYVIVPMQRIERNDQFDGKDPDPSSAEEPQIAFHLTAKENFDERFPYGLRDKTVLLKSLGLPGSWQRWGRPGWLPNDDLYIGERDLYKVSRGGVFRLSSGGAGFEAAGASNKRYAARNFSILSTVMRLNDLHGTPDRSMDDVISSDDHVVKRTARGPNTSSIEDEATDIGKLDGRTLFIGLGAMKAGTTWVSDYLRDQPDVYHSSIKEMNFFNRLDPNPLDVQDKTYLYFRMQRIVLEKGWKYPPSATQYNTLKGLAEVGNLNSVEDYLSFFARRIGDQTRFGEICPQYSLIPPETYRRIEDLGFDTKLLFFMRDPTDRLVSNIQHYLRRNDVDIDARIAAISPEDSRYQRSNYILTLENHKNSGTSMPLETFVYEDLFTETSIKRLCTFLGITYRDPDFDRQVNVSRGQKISASQRDRIREKLEPLYAELSEYFGPDKPKGWRWTA